MPAWQRDIRTARRIRSGRHSTPRKMATCHRLMVEPKSLNSPALPDVLLVGDLLFPQGDATANIMRAHCRAIQEAGLRVGVQPRQVAGRPEDLAPDGGYCYRGIQYWTVYDQRRGTRIRRVLRRHLAYDDGRLSWLRQSRFEGVKAVLVYPVHCTAFLLRVRRLCRSNRVPVLVFATEWYGLRHCGRSPFSFMAIDDELQLRFAVPRFDGVICLSHFLRDYYQSRGCRSVLIPPLVDLSDPRWQACSAPPAQGSPPPLRLLFNGGAFRDRQDIILRAVQRLRQRRLDIVLEYLGSSRSTIEALPGVGDELLDSLGDGVRFHGRVPPDQVPKIIASASFGVLLREHARWSQACFPSKVPEFLALRVPLLCNLTSDLHDYLQDGVNAIIVADTSVGALCSALERAARLTQSQHATLKENAGITAQLFDAKRYAQTYRELLSP